MIQYPRNNTVAHTYMMIFKDIQKKHLLRQKGWKPTAQESCLYHGTFVGGVLLFLHKVDDFTLTQNRGKLNLTNHLWVYVLQTKYYIRLSIFSNYGLILTTTPTTKPFRVYPNWSLLMNRTLLKATTV